MIIMLSIYIRNITGSNDMSDYKYIVMVDAEVLARGKITKHRRKDGWLQLLKRLIEENE